jgi:FkbM family methyltransferase
MNRFEKATVAVRHAPGLDRAEWLWKHVRPAYDQMIGLLAGKRGLERSINGSDVFRLSPLSRWFVAEEYEPEIWARVMREVRPADRVVEVGASFGLYALAFAGRVGSEGHVTAFEPDPESAVALEANVEINGWKDRITVVRAVVGATVGEVRFASAHGLESRIVGDGESRAGIITLPMITLDSAIRDSRVDVLKIDVEGFEHAVLLGARGLLRSDLGPRAIVIEVHPFAWPDAKTDSASFLGLLDACGYRVETATGQRVTEISEYGHVIAIRSSN